jgi:pimeloyl-ACP methyl ester carboxylesterase
MWDDLIAGLPDKTLSISTPSIPGHGNLPEIPSIRTAKVYCEEIMRQIPDDSLPWIVVGHSMGGYLASSLVTMVPDRIAALGFFHSKAASDNAQKKDDRRRAISAASQNKDLYLATMLRNTLAEHNLDVFQKELQTMIDSAKTDITSECIAASHEVMIERPDNVDFLTQAPFPLYYFLGSNDKSIPYEQIKSETEALPQADVHVENNVGHMGHIECREAAAKWLMKVCGN